MSNDIKNSEKELQRELYHLLKDLELDNQVGGGKKYTSNEVDKILRNSLQYILFLYSRTEAEKAAIKAELEKCKNYLVNIPVAVPSVVVPSVAISTVSGILVGSNNLYNGPKTFYLNIVQNKNVFINNLINILRSVLLSMCWAELSDSEANESKTIGFSFSNQKSIVIKSIYNYRIYEFNYKVLTNKSDFYDLIDKKYAPEYYNFTNDSVKIFAKINELNSIPTKKYLLKDPLGSMGSNIVDIKSIDTIDKLNAILAKFKDIKKSGVNISELVDSIIIKKQKVIINDQELRKEDTVGRRSVIRFLFMLNLTKSQIYLHRYEQFYSYLSLEEKNDILDPINFITNIVYKSKDEIDGYYNASTLYKDKKSQDYAFIQKIASGSIDKSNIGKYYVAGKDEIKKSIGDEQFNNLETNIDEFCASLLDKLKKIISCKNDFIFNDDFEGCFNVFAIDCIYTSTNELKILEINTSPGTLDLANNEEFRHFKFSGTRLVVDAINSVIKLQSECKPNGFKLIKQINRYTPSFYAFVGKSRYKNYPEITKNLVNRNYNINIWRPPYNKKKSRVNYGDLAMPKLSGSEEGEDVAEEFEMEGGFLIAPSETDIEEDIDNTKEIISVYENHKFYDISNKILDIATVLGDKRKYYDIIKSKIDKKEILDSDIIAPYIGFKLKTDPTKDNAYVLLDEEVPNTKLTDINAWISERVKANPKCRFIIKPDKGSQSSGIKIIENTQFNSWVSTNYDEKKYITWTMSLFIEGDLISGNKLSKFHTDNESKAAAKDTKISALELNAPRKYHIRGYFLVTKLANEPDIRIYFINRPIIYIAGMKYTTTPTPDESKFVNLTNLARTTEYLGLKKIENVNIDLFTEAYTKTNFVETGPSKITAEKYDKIIAQVIEKGLASINSIKNDLNCINKSSDNYKGCYHLIAIDYHVEKDTNNVYILEVNQGPGMKGLRINYNLNEIYDNILGLTIDRVNNTVYSPSEWMMQLYPVK
jgi:hypothetical protein